MNRAIRYLFNSEYHIEFIDLYICIKFDSPGVTHQDEYDNDVIHEISVCVCVCELHVVD